MSGKAQQARTSRTILQNPAHNTATLHPPSIVQAMASTPLGRLAEAARTSPVLQARAAAMPNRTGLPDGLKANVEAMSGFSMDDVRVHRNSPKPAQLHAHAYAQGTDIHLAPGQEKHLPHEAWHVVQQKQGRVRPTMQLKGVGVNDDAGLEREASQRAHPIQRVIVGPSQDDIWASEIKEKADKPENISIRGLIYKLQMDQTYYRVSDFDDLKKRIEDPIMPEPTYREDDEKLYFILSEILKEHNQILKYEEMARLLVARSEAAEDAVKVFLNQDEDFSIRTIENARPMGVRGMLGHHAFIVFADQSIAEWAGPVTKLKYHNSQMEHRTNERWRVANVKISARRLGNKGQAKYVSYDLDSISHESWPYILGYNDCFTWVNSVLAGAGLSGTKLVRVTEDRLLIWLGTISSIGGTLAYVKYGRK